MDRPPGATRPGDQRLEISVRRPLADTERHFRLRLPVAKNGRLATPPGAASAEPARTAGLRGCYPNGRPVGGTLLVASCRLQQELASEEGRRFDKRVAPGLAHRK